VKPTREVLAAVPLLAGLPPEALDAIAARGTMRDFPPGARMLAELEPGEEAFIILEGTGKVTVGGWGDEPPMTVGEVAAGACVGEMSLFTNELRSATVTASTAVKALALDRAAFNDLMGRHPAIGAHLAAGMGGRLRETERVLSAVLDPNHSDAERRAALRVAPRRVSPKGLVAGISVAWRELVASHSRELPFLMLVTFVATLSLVRAAIQIDRHVNPGGATLKDLLRTSYILGLFLIAGWGTASLMVFRPDSRRVIACFFGVGMALLFNSLPVLLTFDLFYSDIFTPDPAMNFNVEVLYERAEGAHLAIVTAALLLQAVYLRGFYRRMFTLVSMRLLRTKHP
jgi:CRP-like cAMP-binding protein